MLWLTAWVAAAVPHLVSTWVDFGLELAEEALELLAEVLPVLSWLAEDIWSWALACALCMLLQLRPLRLL